MARRLIQPNRIGRIIAAKTFEIPRHSSIRRTSFACGALKITVGEAITARFIVINTGRREGADVLSSCSGDLGVLRRTGCATCRDNCPSSFIGLDARQLPHEANMIAFAAFVQ